MAHQLPDTECCLRRLTWARTHTSHARTACSRLSGSWEQDREKGSKNVMQLDQSYLMQIYVKNRCIKETKNDTKMPLSLFYQGLGRLDPHSIADRCVSGFHDTASREPRIQCLSSRREEKKRKRQKRPLTLEHRVSSVSSTSSLLCRVNRNLPSLSEWGHRCGNAPKHPFLHAGQWAISRPVMTSPAILTMIQLPKHSFSQLTDSSSF
ncbi:hypothetical protein GGR55DRAFT_253806 [Xylaria sp. FL0064]|nr:hypothetical protein GGR55DRAFT_253806 [Xylaria sp. FL0064]